VGEAKTERFITIDSQRIPVCEEADVLVVGGGPAGQSAAVSAARQGAKTVLLERYGHLGGMATGGLVTMLHSLSDGTNESIIAGNCLEWLTRLDKYGAADRPVREDVGSDDPKALERFNGPYFRNNGHLIDGARFDPEVLKYILNEMVLESGAHLYLHALATDVIMENNELKGVVFDSKSGRQAVLAKTVVDASGDGDILALSGCSFELCFEAKNRLSTPALCFEFGNVDWSANEAFKRDNPEKHSELMKQLAERDGLTMYFKVTTKRDTVCHFNMFLKGYNTIKVEDLTRIEVDVRRRMMITYTFFKENVPGFSKCFIMQTAPQIGNRGSRKLLGVHYVTEEEALSGKQFEDTFAEFPPLKGLYPEYPHFFFPLSALLPKEVENLIVAGRTFSADDEVNEHFNTISHSTIMGQAAGVAGAIAAKTGVKIRDVDAPSLRAALKDQGIKFKDFAG
jgi:hypothetical protein